MMFLRKIPPTSNFFFGWYILASSFVILFLNAGARVSFGIMFKPMIAEFGWNRGSISLAFFVNMIFYALSLTIIGRFYDRYGPKWVIIISTIFLSAGYTLISLVDSLWQFFVYYGIITAIGLGGTSIPLIAALMSKWFEKWRGLTISLALSGNSLGQFVLVPLFTIFTLRYGWRTSYFCIASIMLVVNITLALLVMKGDPEDLGLRPFGSGEKTNGKEAKIPSVENLRDLGLGEAMRTRSFWLFIIVMFICGSGDFLVITHLIPFVTDYGISPITAGNMLAWYGLMSLAGIMVAGLASDLIGNKIPIALTFLLRVLLFLLILKYQNLASFYIFALSFGFTYLITAPLTPILIGRLYGISHVGVITGFITTIHHLGGGFWAYMGGLIFDQMGSYRLAFILSAIMALVAVISSIFIVERRHQAIQ
ncbi:MAG: MFS transporter [Syntrophobacterales bacterium]|nr:MAG: MFS transporter [Syntrophobacterales bacterium]